MTGPNLHAQAKRLSLCGFRALVCENPLEGTAPGAPDAAETVLQLHWLDEMREPFRAMLETRGLAPDEALHSEEAGAVAALAVLGLLSLKLVQNRLAARGIAARLADVRQALANAAALVLPDGRDSALMVRVDSGPHALHGRALPALDDMLAACGLEAAPWMCSHRELGRSLGTRFPRPGDAVPGYETLFAGTDRTKQTDGAVRPKEAEESAPAYQSGPAEGQPDD